KMGSPLREVGVINADVSTCIAGWLGKVPDMLPMRMTVSTGAGNPPKTFDVELARQESLLSSLVFTGLVNAIDMEGELPDEMTADVRVQTDIEGREPLVLKDTF